MTDLDRLRFLAGIPLNEDTKPDNVISDEKANDADAEAVYHAENKLEAALKELETMKNKELSPAEKERKGELERNVVYYRKIIG